MFQAKNHAYEAGNAMIYILLALALLGALTMMLSRQNEQSDSQDISDELASVYATDIMAYAASTQGVIDQMLMTGSEVSDLNFVLPNTSSYDTGSNIHKVFHPEGGGLNYTSGRAEAFTGTDNDPDPGWYLGLFNQVEWTPSTTNDVILTAHQISEKVCEKINENLTGSTTVPALAGTGNIADYLIDESLHSSSNATFNSTVCGACDGMVAMCVSNSGGTMWSYYAIIEGQ